VSGRTLPHLLMELAAAGPPSVFGGHTSSRVVGLLYACALRPVRWTLGHQRLADDRGSLAAFRPGPRPRRRDSGSGRTIRPQDLEISIDGGSAPGTVGMLHG
jgi:hypothetical protein